MVRSEPLPLFLYKGLLFDIQLWVRCLEGVEPSLVAAFGACPFSFLRVHVTFTLNLLAAHLQGKPEMVEAFYF